MHGPDDPEDNVRTRAPKHQWTSSRCLFAVIGSLVVFLIIVAVAMSLILSPPQNTQGTQALQQAGTGS